MAAELADAEEKGRARVASSGWTAARRASRAASAVKSAASAERGERSGSPPPPRTQWTRRVPHPVLIGHAASLSQSGTGRAQRGAARRGRCGAGGGGGGRRRRRRRRPILTRVVEAPRGRARVVEAPRGRASQRGSWRVLANQRTRAPRRRRRAGAAQTMQLRLRAGRSSRQAIRREGRARTGRQTRRWRAERRLRGGARLRGPAWSSGGGSGGSRV